MTAAALQLCVRMWVFPRGGGAHPSTNPVFNFSAKVLKIIVTLGGLCCTFLKLA